MIFYKIKKQRFETIKLQIKNKIKLKTGLILFHFLYFCIIRNKCIKLNQFKPIAYMDKIQYDFKINLKNKKI